jgi:hypothetical protein
MAAMFGGNLTTESQLNYANWHQPGKIRSMWVKTVASRFLGLCAALCVISGFSRAAE